MADGGMLFWTQHTQNQLHLCADLINDCPHIEYANRINPYKEQRSVFRQKYCMSGKSHSSKLIPGRDPTLLWCKPSHLSEWEQYHLSASHSWCSLPCPPIFAGTIFTP